MTKRKRVKLPGHRAWADFSASRQMLVCVRTYKSGFCTRTVRVVRESELRKWLKENGR